jgi:hypothetical protein
MINLGFGSEKSKSTTNPWAPQIPYLESGFGRADDLYNLSAEDAGWRSIQDILSQYGQQLMPNIGTATNFAQGQMQNPGAAQYNPYAADSQGYNAITQDYWTPPYEMASQQMQSDLMENFRRTDAGDAMGASLAGQGVGPRSTEYLQARALGLGETQDAISRGLVGLHQGAMGTATQRANNYAGSFQNNQASGLESLWRSGVAGANMLPQSYQFGQDALWNPLQNYWNIVAGANWGGTTKGKGSNMSMGFEFAPKST